MPFSIHQRLCWITLLLITALGTANALGWPTYQHDYARSGVTAETVKPPLQAAWVYRAPAAPQPAWPAPQDGPAELSRVAFDDALYTAAANGLVYFGSSVDHQVYALDAATGQVRWRFFTDGPVRLAPTVWHGGVYVGSDDGFAYCLDAANGKLRWKVRGGPDARRVLGSGRLISLWPVRTGVIVDRETAYFGAGSFPNHGVFLTAVKAADGSPVWRVPGFQGKRETGATWFTPQGYLLASDRYLFAPSARAVPCCFNRADGANAYVVGKLPLPQAAMGLDKGVAGGTNVMLADGLLFSGAQNSLYGFSEEGSKLQATWSGVRRLLATPERYYTLGGPPVRGGRPSTVTEITAIDRAALPPGPRDAEALKAATRWRFPAKGFAALILAGSILFAGGNNTVVALDAGSGKQLWQAEVDGRAVGLAAAEGRLLVSTDRGAIHCFAPAAPALPAPAMPAALPADPAATALAQAIVTDTGITRGCCLLVGAGSARLAAELARSTPLRLFACEPDPARVEQVRAALDAAGQYGTRVTVDLAGDALPYPNYFANLVVALDGTLPAEELLRVLRPCGGTLVRAGLTAVPDAWQQAGTARAGCPLPGGAWVKLVRAPLEGAGSWTHQYANPGNTTSSEDQRVRGQLDVLWYGEPGPGEMPDRHLRGPAPLSSHGRVFYLGCHARDQRQYVGCFDAYNGTQYWERELPGAYRVRISSEPGNLACTADALFVVTGASCSRLDARTGEIVAAYPAPAQADGAPGRWSYLAVTGHLLIGSLAKDAQFSNTLFAIDLRDGTQRWLYRGGAIRGNTLAICDGRLLFAELRDGAPPATETDIDRAKRLGLADDAKLPPPVMRTITALELETGRTAWMREADLVNCGAWNSHLTGMAKDGVYVLCGVASRYGGLKGVEAARRASAFAIADGAELWNNAVGNLSRPLIMGDLLVTDPHAVALRTGKPHLVTDPKTGRNIPWKQGFVGAGCGPMTASAGMLFFRYGFTAWYDIATRRGTVFSGPRPGCWMNLIPANGLLIETEASSGCICYHSLQCTVVYQPREGQ